MDIAWYYIVAIVGALIALAGFLKWVKKTDTFKAVGIVVLIVGVIFAGIDMGWFTKTAAVGTPGNTAANQASGGAIITTNPTISVIGNDKLSPGTAVGSSIQYRLAGTGGFATASSTTLVPGQTVDLLVTNATTYHSVYVPSFTVTAQSFPLSVAFLKNATATENIYSTVGVVLSNGAGKSSNQTALGAGQSYNLKDEFTAGALQGTQDMTCVVELSAGVNASTTPAGVILSLNGQAIPLKSTSTPTWYTVAGTDSRVFLFDVPAVTGGVVNTYNININPATGKEIFGAGKFVLKTCYTKEWFVDPVSGQPTYDVADGNGVIKSLAQYQYKVYAQ